MTSPLTPFGRSGRHRETSWEGTDSRRKYSSIGPGEADDAGNPDGRDEEGGFRDASSTTRSSIVCRLRGIGVDDSAGTVSVDVGGFVKVA